MSFSSAARILVARSLTRVWAKVATRHVQTLSVLSLSEDVNKSGKHNGALASLLAVGVGALVVGNSFSTDTTQCEDRRPSST